MLNRSIGVMEDLGYTAKRSRIFSNGEMSIAGFISHRLRHSSTCSTRLLALQENKETVATVL
jgi:hypothetical protein